MQGSNVEVTGLHDLPNVKARDPGLVFAMTCSITRLCSAHVPYKFNHVRNKRPPMCSIESTQSLQLAASIGHEGNTIETCKGGVLQSLMP